jgi:type VI secretion system protein ImpC
MTEAQAAAPAAAPQLETGEPSAFQQALKEKFRPRDTEQADRVEGAVRALAQQALADQSLVSGDVVRTIQGMIAAIDRKLTEQVNEILHHPEFQALEGTWRGLHYLVNNTESDEML